MSNRLYIAMQRRQYHMKKKLLIGILMGLIGISMPFYTNATIPDIAGADPEWITESDEIEYCNRDINEIFRLDDTGIRVSLDIDMQGANDGLYVKM